MVPALLTIHKGLVVWRLDVYRHLAWSKKVKKVEKVDLSQLEQNFLLLRRLKKVKKVENVDLSRLEQRILAVKKGRRRLRRSRM